MNKKDQKRCKTTSCQDFKLQFNFSCIFVKTLFLLRVVYFWKFQTKIIKVNSYSCVRWRRKIYKTKCYSHYLYKTATFLFLRRLLAKSVIRSVTCRATDSANNLPGAGTVVFRPARNIVTELPAGQQNIRFCWGVTVRSFVLWTFRFKIFSAK